jgi:hypothetical protein
MAIRRKFVNKRLAPALAAASLLLAFSPASHSQTVSDSSTASAGMVIPGSEWQLPCETKLDSEGHRRPSTTSGTRLKGSVTEWNIDSDFGQMVDALLDGAVGSNPESTKLDRAVAHYRKKAPTLLSGAGDAANYLIPYRGFAPSSEAADIILDEKIKVKDRASAEYARQRFIDELHPQLVARVMQLAHALGIKDFVKREETIGRAMSSLQQMVGKQRAELALQKLTEWSKLSLPETAYAGAADWDVEQFQTTAKRITKLGMDGDPVMQDIVNRLKKYNHHNAVSRVASHVIPGSLSVGTWLAPGWGIPIALEIINAGYVMATGGPEENKLVKELYYDKRVESRYRVINEETTLALTQYQAAVHTRNPALLICCESVLSQLAGAENLSSVLGTTFLSHELPPSAMAASEPQPIN